MTHIDDATFISKGMTHTKWCLLHKNTLDILDGTLFKTRHHARDSLNAYRRYSGIDMSRYAIGKVDISYSNIRKSN